jgi:cyclic pyranopterin phosphate synthase
MTLELRRSPQFSFPLCGNVLVVAHGGVNRTILCHALGLDLTAWTRDLAAQEGLVPEVMGAGAGPARYWRSADGRMSLGVITPMSQHFCEACNRVRLTVDGTLLLCLGQEDQVPLGRMLRQGASDDELRSAIRDAVWHKPERHEFREQPAKVVRFMSQTGG